MSQSDMFAKIAAMQQAGQSRKQAEQVALVVRAEQREQKKAELRASMPVIAAFVDELRDSFGEGVRVMYAFENGLEVGRKR